MFKPGLVTVFRPNWRKPKKLPKPLVAAFVLIQLFFGINYGFFAAVANRRLRALANLVSTLNFLLGIILYGYIIFKWDWDWGAALFALHYSGVFITMLLSKYTVYNFLTDLMAVDVTLNFDTNSYIGLKTSVLLFFAYCFRIVIFVLYCLSLRCFEKGPMLLIMYVIYETKNSLPFLLTSVNILIYKVVYLRLITLKMLFKQRERQIKHLTMIFKALADCFSKIRVSQDNLVVLEFLVNFIKCVLIVWVYLKHLKESPDLLVSILINAETVFLMFQICLPAVIGEMIAIRIDEIKLLIHERLLIETNYENNKDLIDLLRYIEARSLVHKAWRLVPVDLRLPVSLLSMSATYLIVLIQLTHLY